MFRGRAILRIENVEGSVLEGVVFNGGGMERTCLHLTGNARRTVVRDCSFAHATRVAVQIGDYVVPDPDPAASVRALDVELPRRHERSEAAYDLSGTCFTRCEINCEGVPVVFHAWRTAPLIFDG